MKFFAVAAALAATAVALPNANGGHQAPGQVSVEEANNKCGRAQASCCNKKIDSGDDYEKNGGLLGGVLKDLLGASGQDSKTIGLFDNCSPLSVLGNHQCEQNIACCDGNESKGGLINVALPCIPIQGLL